MTAHSLAHGARASERGRATDSGVKFAWDCAQCGAWSGYRYRSVEAAERGAAAHNVNAEARDRERYLRMYSPQERPEA